RHPFIVHRRENENKDNDKKAWNRFLRLPVQRLKTGVLKPAKHHKGKKEQQRRQNKPPTAEMMFSFSEPKEEQRNRCNQTGSSGNGKTGESVLVIGSLILRCGIEPRQAQRAASQVNERDDPARARELLQHDTVNHQRRRHPERNNVGERVELAPKWTLVSPQACNPSIQKIKNECAKDKPDRLVESIGCEIGIGALQQRAFKNSQRSGKSAKQISRRH